MHPIQKYVGLAWLNPVFDIHDPLVTTSHMLVHLTLLLGF